MEVCVGSGLRYLESNDGMEDIDVNQFDRKSVRREKDYKTTKSDKMKKKAFKRDFRY
jgi:hypothetical protein